MRHLFYALALTFLAASAASANEVFRTVNPDGTVTYSDRPLSAASERVGITSQPTDPAAVEAELAARRQAERAGQGAPRDDLSAALAEQRALREQACAEARQAAETYERAPRLYEELPGGGRRFLSEEEMAAARQAARQAVIDFCGQE
jgi:hypothetical protein